MAVGKLLLVAGAVGAAAAGVRVMRKRRRERSVRTAHEPFVSEPSVLYAETVERATHVEPTAKSQ